MRIEVFDVEHGACTLVTADTGAHILIDCGHNSTTGWRPSTHLPSIGVKQLSELMVTNYDEDHVSDLANLIRVLPPQILRRNMSVAPRSLRNLKTKDGMGLGIDALANLASEYAPIGPASLPDYGALSFVVFRNSYPGDFDDENNLSLAVFLKYPTLNMLFPGDMEIEGWRKLLQNPTFVEELNQVHVLMASHHGRKSGCCEELFTVTGWRPQIVVISDCCHQYETQETLPWYRARSTGVNFYGERRQVFTTRSDGRIMIEARPNGATIDTSSRQIREMVGLLAG